MPKPHPTAVNHQVNFAARPRCQPAARDRLIPRAHPHRAVVQKAAQAPRQADHPRLDRPFAHDFAGKNVMRMKQPDDQQRHVLDPTDALVGPLLRQQPIPITIRLEVVHRLGLRVGFVRNRTVPGALAVGNFVYLQVSGG